MTEEDPFVIAERAWECAIAIVNGSPVLPHDADEVVLGVPVLRVLSPHSKRS
jgi:hypothetical protein